MVVAADLLDLGAQQLLEAAVIGEAGELVGDRLALTWKCRSTFSSASVACAASERSSVAVVVGERRARRARR